MDKLALSGSFYTIINLSLRCLYSLHFTVFSVIILIILLQVELPGCKGIWTVYHKNTRGLDSSKVGVDDDEYHAYLIISLESRTMVISLALC